MKKVVVSSVGIVAVVMLWGEWKRVLRAIAANKQMCCLGSPSTTPEGQVARYRDMPWAYYSNWTEEDRHAVVVYLRHLKAVPH